MLKLISINIEGDMHYDAWMPFVERERPDVIAFQEILEEDIPMISEKTGMTPVIVGQMSIIPRSYRYGGGENKTWSVALFSRIPFQNPKKSVYVGEPTTIPLFKAPEDPTKNPLETNLVLVSAEFIFDGKTYTIATTHFTWTPEGSVTPYQLEHLPKLLSVLETYTEGVAFCGDFNAPRGRETFDRLASAYKDNIPVEYKTSIDQNLHRVKGIMFMVDGLFTTPNYKAENIRLVDGVSDHMAIVGEIIKL